MQVTTVGLDLAKDVFQVHGVTANGLVVFNRSVRRSQLLPFFEKLPPCLVGMEACGSSHHWAREISKLGHEVRLMPALYVKPYVKRGKTDAVDAAAICEAVTRPTIRFVEVKEPEQQALLGLHRVRDLVVRQRTQVINMIRGLLREFGHILPKGPRRRDPLRQELPRRRSPGYPRSGEGPDLHALRPTDGALQSHLHVLEAGRATFPSRQACLAVAFDPRRRPDDGFSHRRDDRRWEAVSKRTRTGGLARIDAV